MSSLCAALPAESGSGNLLVSFDLELFPARANGSLGPLVHVQISFPIQPTFRQGQNHFLLPGQCFSLCCSTIRFWILNEIVSRLYCIISYQQTGLLLYKSNQKLCFYRCCKLWLSISLHGTQITGFKMQAAKQVMCTKEQTGLMMLLGRCYPLTCETVLFVTASAQNRAHRWMDGDTFYSENIHNLRTTVQGKRD